MEVINPNGVKVYNLSSGKSFPKFLSPAQRRKLAKDDDYRTRIELIQDFEFNQACQKIKVSADGNFIMTSGVYPPMVKCYDTQQMSEKFRRHLECEIVQFQFLSDDFSKFAFLLSDRTLEFHARYGFHYRTRIPKFGRDITYNKEKCELYAVGSSSEIYRLDLEQGTFMAPIQAHCPELNKIVLAPVHQMIAVANIRGEVECYDSRSRDCLQCVKIFENETRDLRFSNDGMTMAVGSNEGEVKLFDIRNNKPFLELEHNYETPIVSIKFCGDHLLTADTKTIKISNLKTNECLCNLEPEAPINHMNVVGDSGLVLVAAEQPKIVSYFIPSLGTAPRWCSFLDNIAEELEEEKSGVYDDYKFVTRQELARLGLENLIGTDLLKAYMHGYFMANKLYQRSCAIAEPSKYDEYKSEKNKKIQKENKEKRITINRRKPAVNEDLAEKWEKAGKNIPDARFGDLFANRDFQIDETSEEYRRLHTAASSRQRGGADAEDSEEENSDEVFEEDFELLNTHDGEERDQKPEVVEEGSEEEEINEFRGGRKGRKAAEEKDRIKPTKRPVKFYGVKEDSKIIIPTSKDDLKKEAEKRKEKRMMTLGQRAKELNKKRR